MPWEYIGGGGGQIDVSKDKCGLEQPYLSKAYMSQNEQGSVTKGRL